MKNIVRVMVMVLVVSFVATSSINATVKPLGGYVPEIVDMKI